MKTIEKTYLVTIREVELKHQEKKRIGYIELFMNRTGENPSTRTSKLSKLIGRELKEGDKVSLYIGGNNIKEWQKFHCNKDDRAYCNGRWHPDLPHPIDTGNVCVTGLWAWEPVVQEKDQPELFDNV